MTSCDNVSDKRAASTISREVILDATGRAVNTYDRLNSTERKKVDECVRRKGH